MEWFKEEWLSSDSKALGIYMALLYTRFNHFDKEVIKADVSKEMEKVLKGKELDEARKVVNEFIEKLYSIYPSFKERDKALEEIEKRYYEIFKNTCYKYWYSLKEKKEKETPLARVLKKYFKLKDKTSCGSFKIMPMRDALEKAWDTLRQRRILWFNYIIPAPYLEEEFLEKLEKEKIIEVERIKEKIEVKERFTIEEYEGRKPSSEILKLIVADVLESFGFKVEMDKIETVEVDIWGSKVVRDTRIHIYVSYRNWDKKVGVNEILTEIGRISRLMQQPHLKIFICKEATERAREVALAEGFIIVELKDRANCGDAGKIAEIIYERLNELFLGIALREVPESVKKKLEEFGINWSIAIRRMIENKIQDLIEIDEIISKSKMTEKDALELAKKINRLIAERFEKDVTCS